MADWMPPLTVAANTQAPVRGDYGQVVRLPPDDAQIEEVKALLNAMLDQLTQITTLLGG